MVEHQNCRIAQPNIPFADLHFDPSIPLVFTVPEKKILREGIERGELLIAFEDT